jgi:hypothetical protein
MGDLRKQFPTFDDLLDYAAGIVMKKLLAGEFRVGVYHAMDLAIRWTKEKE